MILWIDGPINAGKTTVCQELVARRPRTVHIEVDDLRHFADCLTLAEAIQPCIEDAASLTRNWRARGFDVILSWPVSPQNFRAFCAQAEEPVVAVTLMPRLDVAQRQRGARRLLERELIRIEQMYRDREARPPIGLVIDNSDQTVVETIAQIESQLHQRLVES